MARIVSGAGNRTIKRSFDTEGDGIAPSITSLPENGGPILELIGDDPRLNRRFIITLTPAETEMTLVTLLRSRHNGMDRLRQRILNHEATCDMVEEVTA